MRRYLLLLTAAVGLPLAMAGATEARPMMGMGAGIGVGSSFNARASNMAIIHSRTTLRSRAEVREPGFRPPGWSHGRKIGWHCHVGTRSCRPPGLR